ncbi:hypothetical protein B0H17DRAFT_1193775 [Mycena rosella]|uniref:Uncharacterized protein n=1 Tax=Mycena rosella TaxID=1033263 RepID=A0AAD7GSW7_MYCRO|nr:hypothetical protein B0H17DRAFT_1193775 [Mycena rosella]
MGKAKRPTPCFPVRDEFLNLDFSTMQLVHEFSLHPFMCRLSREQFEHMAQFAPFQNYPCFSSVPSPSSCDGRDIEPQHISGHPLCRGLRLHPACLELSPSYRREPVEYAHLPDGVLKYVTKVLRLYAKTIVHCIPVTVFCAIDLRSGREGEIGLYGADYVCQAAICYDIAMAQAEISKAPRAAIDTQCTHVLSPSAEYAPQGRAFFLLRIRLAIHLIAEGGTPGATLDVPLPLEILALPHVPAWDAREIAVLAKSEIYTYMQCKMLLMDEEVNEASQLIEALEHVQEYQAMDYWSGPSGQRSV